MSDKFYLSGESLLTNFLSISSFIAVRIISLQFFPTGGAKLETTFALTQSWVITVLIVNIMIVVLIVVLTGFSKDYDQHLDNIAT